MKFQIILMILKYKLGITISIVNPSVCILQYILFAVSCSW